MQAEPRIHVPFNSRPECVLKNLHTGTTQAPHGQLQRQGITRMIHHCEASHGGLVRMADMVASGVGVIAWQFQASQTKHHAWWQHMLPPQHYAPWAHGSRLCLALSVGGRVLLCSKHGDDTLKQASRRLDQYLSEHLDRWVHKALMFVFTCTIALSFHAL